MEFLKEVFGEKALTYAELEQALKDNQEIKLGNLASGRYVDRQKLNDTQQALEAANNTIEELREKVSRFDGVDVEGLQKEISDLKTKYDEDLGRARLNSALDMALVEARAKNPKLARAGLNMDAIRLEDGHLVGLEEQLQKLKETDAYLFEETQTSTSRVDSGKPHQGDVKREVSSLTEALQEKLNPKT